jgi:hypothetical protein
MMALNLKVGWFADITKIIEQETQDDGRANEKEEKERVMKNIVAT